jgi:hypothetical protein
LEGGSDEGGDGGDLTVRVVGRLKVGGVGLTRGQMDRNCWSMFASGERRDIGELDRGVLVRELFKSDDGDIDRGCATSNPISGGPASGTEDGCGAVGIPDILGITPAILG